MDHTFNPMDGAFHCINIADTALYIVHLPGPSRWRCDIEHAHGFAGVDKGTNQMRA